MWLYVCVAIVMSLLYLWNKSSQMPTDLEDRQLLRAIDILLKLLVKFPSAVMRKLNPVYNVYYERLMLRITFEYLLPRYKKVPYEQLVTRIKTTFDGVEVIVYVPKQRKTQGAVVYFHGGGWVIGTADVTNECTSDLACRIGCVIVSVTYRLAPEFPFPTGLDDCERATVHFLTGAYRDYAVDPAKIGLMGESAGGNLAAVVAVRLKANRLILPIKFQVLLYPVMQAVDFKTPSYQTYYKRSKGSVVVLSPYNMIEWFLHYVGVNVDDNIMHDLSVNFHITPTERGSARWAYVSHDILPEEFRKKINYDWPMYLPGKVELYEKLKPFLFNPEISPIFYDDDALFGLPKAMIVTAGYDILRDDGYWYSERLKTNGVQVTYKHYAVAIHGLMMFGNISKTSLRLRQDVADYVLESMR